MKRIGIFFFSALLIISCETSTRKDIPVQMKVLWSQDDTTYNNYRIPSLIVTKNNTVLAFSEGREEGDAGNIDILLRRSLDNGKTWEEQIVVWDDSVNSCGNPCPVIDQNTGRINLLMTWNLGSDHEADIIRKRSKNTRIPFISYSDDDGLTWSKPKNLLESCKDEDWGWYATGPGVGIQILSGEHSGRLVIPCNNSFTEPENISRDGFGYGCHLLLSDDGGMNWRRSEIITTNVNESQIVELNDGVLMMNMRSYHGKACRAISYSHDGGETWSEVQNEPQLVESTCQASLIQYGSFKQSEMYLFSNPSVSIGRTHMTIKASFDDCETWSNSKLVYTGPSAYSSMTKLPDGNIGLFFEAGENNSYEKMVFLSFTPDVLFMHGTLIDTIKDEY
jgi:sialidase-1